jgi:hypothetical protein
LIQSGSVPNARPVTTKGASRCNICSSYVLF